MRDIYAEITDRIVASLEEGKKPWVPHLDPDKVAPMAPFNPTTGQRYRGINTILLSMSPHTLMSGDPRYCTYKQAQENGWQVRKGEKSTGIIFYKPLQAKDDEDATERPVGRMMHVLKAYSVFNASQIDGMPPYRIPTLDEAPWRRPEAAQTILTNSHAKLEVGGDKAFYRPDTDTIHLPKDDAFKGPREWAATAMHELGHWTGAESRMNRDIRNRFGTPRYALEELRAEMASAFIGGALGIPLEPSNHASYIGSWLRPLKDDKREVFRAAGDAQKIADHVLEFHPEYRLSLTAGKVAAPEAGAGGQLPDRSQGLQRPARPVSAARSP